jgi:DNA-3-methyladenine glycosylase II
VKAAVGTGVERARVKHFSCAIPLPETFRADNILAFHRRDPQQIAEVVGDAALKKGMVWHGAPACLSIRFQSGQAKARLEVDGGVERGSRTAFEAMIRRMLGLTQSIDEFERCYHRHRQVGPLIARQPGLRVPLAATPFEALTWAVTGQQISVGAAVSLRRKLIVAAGVCHSSGLHCYPDARQVLTLGEDALRQAGFSTAKTSTLLTVAQQVVDDRLPLDAWSRTLPITEIQEGLLAVRGIGPWTVDYALLRGFGWLDGSLHGDAAVRRGLQVLLGSSQRVGEKQATEWLAGFSPWRALVAAHLWASQSSPANDSSAG